MPHLWKNRLFLILFLWMHFTHQEAYSQDGLDLARKIAKENRKTVEAIRSMECESSITITDGKGNPHPDQRIHPSGKFWSAEGTSRFRFEKENGGWNDCLLKNGVRTSVSCSVNANGQTYFGAIDKNDLLFPGADLERRCLFQLNRMKPIEASNSNSLSTNLYIEDLFSENYRIFQSCKTLPDQTISIEFHVANKYKHEFLVDPKRNHLITRYSIIPNQLSKETPLQKTTSVLNFEETAPGILIPNQMVEEFILNGKLDRKEITTLSNIEINKPSTANQLKINFPPGTRVTDSIRGKKCKARSDGTLEDIGEIQSSPPSPAESSAFSGPSRDEPTSYSWLFLPLGFVFFFAAILVFWWKARTAST